MNVAASIGEARAMLAELPRPLGFVPTMGALHAGHLKLVAAARSQCATVAASVFVNPMQFGPDEDFERYPRDFNGDRSKLAAAGVALLFAPERSEIYPAGFSTSIDVGAAGKGFEGDARPTHFTGVATVVAKLLNIMQPDVLFVGQKDAQQSAVLRRLVRDLDFPVRVEVVATERESDGLALSSRNAYLNQAERAAAPSLQAALRVTLDALESGESKTRAIDRGRKTLDPLAQFEYLDVVSADTFEPMERFKPPAFIIGAARFGETRLLDNLWVA
ncbi:MAG: pantoate--beta-alanine ligase [Candidatus Eremiobacteraeota bacterium]|nr:pantoate--beta-alanine ligase [Candidatus Eremiobacteraeota bacterium]